MAAELDGLVLAAGGAKSEPGFEQRWLATIRRSGCVEDIEIDGEAAFGAEGLVLGIAAHPDHGAYAVGKQELRIGDGIGYESHVWVRRYAADGVVEWTIEESSETDAIASGVAIDLDGSAIVVGGTASAAGQGWVRRYRSDGTRIDRWTLTEAEPTHVLDASVSRVGQRWISGWTEDDSLRPVGVVDSPSAFVASLDSSDEIQWFSPAPSMTSARLAPCSVAPIVVGPRNSVASWDTQGQEVWTTVLESRQIEPIRGHVMADGSILVVGSQRANPVLIALGPDGSLVGIVPVPEVERGEVSDVSVAEDGAIYFAGLRRVPESSPATCANWVARASLR